MQKNRVVVTGLGVVSSVGIGKDEFWKSVISGKSGISKVSFFDTKEFRCHYAGEIKHFQPEEYISKRRLPFLGRTSQLTITAATLAFKDAKLPHKKYNNKRVKYDRRQNRTFRRRKMHNIKRAKCRICSYKGSWYNSKVFRYIVSDTKCRK